MSSRGGSMGRLGGEGHHGRPLLRFAADLDDLYRPVLEMIQQRTTSRNSWISALRQFVREVRVAKCGLQFVATPRTARLSKHRPAAETAAR
jgi:hypothetical protein